MCMHTGLMSELKDCGLPDWYTYVFIGSISFITPIEKDEQLLQIIPEEVFAGEPAIPLTVRTSQGACWPELVAGDRWLFYLQQKKGEPILLDYYGNDSLPLDNAQEQIEILRRLKTLGNHGIIRGHVLRGQFYDGTAVPNARVVAKRKSIKGQFVTRTDDNGRYEFDSLPSGKYAIKVDRTGNFNPDSTELELAGGACWDLTIAKDR
jgi:hypothetical protein